MPRAHCACGPHITRLPSEPFLLRLLYALQLCSALVCTCYQTLHGLASKPLGLLLLAVYLSLHLISLLLRRQTLSFERRSQ